MVIAVECIVVGLGNVIAVALGGYCIHMPLQWSVLQCNMLGLLKESVIMPFFSRCKVL